MSSCGRHAVMERERKNHAGGAWGLLWSARKFTGSGFGVCPSPPHHHRPRWPHWCFCRSKPVDAGWLSDVFKSSSSTSPRQSQPPWRRVPPRQGPNTTRPHTVKLAARGPVALNPSALKPVATICDPSKFRIVLYVGHTASQKARSAPTQRRRVSPSICALRRQIEKN